MKQKVWQIIYISISIFGTGLLWYYWQKEHRVVSVSVVSCVTAASLGENKIPHLRMEYEGRQINSLSIAEMIVKNEGNSSIKSEDFSAPLQIKFPSELAGSPVLVSKRPSQLAPVFKVVNGKAVELEPLLLNPDDTIRFKVNLVDFQENVLNIDVSGRIYGVSEISINDKFRLPTKNAKENSFGFEISAESKPKLFIILYALFFVLYIFCIILRRVVLYVSEKVMRYFDAK